MSSTLTSADARRFTSMSNRLDRTPSVGVGDSGGAVGALESVLQALGYPAEVDTDFTAATAATVKSFQTAVGLDPTGELDLQTMAKLKGALVRLRNNPTAVTLGEKSAETARVEHQLAELGYRSGRADGIADGRLAHAIKAFERDQAEFNKPRQMLGEEGQAVLRREVGRLNHDAYRDRVAPTASAERMDGVLAELSHRQNPDGTMGLGEGGHRPAIEQLQRRLVAAGFDPKHVNGKFDQRTKGALEAFQRAVKVPVSGRLDGKTWAELKKTLIYSKEPASPAQRVGERSNEVKATERLLAKAGFKPGKIDGLFSKETAKAVRAFERKANRTVDGVMGGKDLAALRKSLAADFSQPKPDYRRLAFRGHTLNGRTIQMVEQAEAWAKKHGLPAGWPIFQGSYNTGVSDSGGTHDGGGALDIDTSNMSEKQILTAVEAMRRAGFAAWHRDDAAGWADDHIHAIAIGDRQMSAAAHVQVVEYFHGGDGLSGSFPDPHTRIGRPIPDWAKKFKP